MKTIINYKNRLIRIRNCLFIILFFLSAVVIHAQTQTVYSPVSLPSNDVSMEDMVRLDYKSLFYLDADPEQGIMGNINSEGGRVDVKIYAYDASRPNGRGIEIYHTYITSSSPDSYAKGHTTRENVLDYIYIPLRIVDIDPSNTTGIVYLDASGQEPLDPNYKISPFIVDSNDIKRRAQDARVNNSPPNCDGKSSWTDLFLPDNSCIEDYVAETQPVIAEITTTGDATFLDAKIPGIGVISESHNRVIRGVENPLNGFAYCKIKRNRFWASDFCGRYYKMRNPDISKTDFIIVAHRGWWGYDLGSGPPENTRDAVNKANGKGVKFIEMDLTISSDNELIFMHDYIMKRLTNYTGDEYSFDLPWTTMKDYKVKKRNGDISDHTLSQFYEVVDEIKHHGMVMMVDIKEKLSNGIDPNCLGNCNFQSKESQKQSWAIIAKKAIGEGQERNTGMNLVFKTYYSYNEVVRLIGEDLMKTVLWVPMLTPNQFKTNGRYDISLMANFIDVWYEDTNGRDIVVYFETNFFPADDVMLQEFTRNGSTYENLLHYVHATTGRRAGVFSEEPVGPKGTVNRWGKWKIKNPKNDIRGDFLRIVNIPYGEHMIITTDRLDVWEAMYKHSEKKTHYHTDGDL